MTKEKKDNLDETYRRAQEFIVRGDVRRCFSTLLDVLRENPFHGKALAAAARTAGLLGDAEGSSIFKKLHEAPENPQNLYAAGYFLVSMGRADIGRSFLKACLDRAPGNAAVRYELGYALFLLHEYDEAAGHLAAAAEDLSPERRAAARLLIVECRLYGGRLDEAVETLSSLEEGEEAEGREDTVEALRLMAARLLRFGRDRPGSLREWHFVQHGGVILALSRDPERRGRFGPLAMNPAAVGAVLRLLRTFLDGMGIGISAVVHPGGESRPLAVAAGLVLDRPTRPLSEKGDGRELLVVPDQRALEGIERVARDRESIPYLFCFRMNPSARCPVLPDIIGLMASTFRFPWQERIEVIGKEGERGPAARAVPADDRDTEAIAAKIATLGRSLPEDPAMTQALKFYRKHRDLLVAANREAFPIRRAFEPSSPV